MIEMSNSKAQMTNECQMPKTQPSYPDIFAIRCLLLIPCYSFVICLSSIALGHFGHLTEGLGI